MNYFTHQPAEPLADLPEVISAEVACRWVKVPVDDPEVPMLVKAAMRRVESYCQQPIFRRDFRVTLRGFDSGYFGAIIPVEVKSVTYQLRDVDDFEELDAENYYVYGNRIDFTQGFLTSGFAFDALKATQITITAGYPAEAVPDDIKLAILRLTSHAYNNRDDSKKEFPGEVEALLDPYRLISV